MVTLALIYISCCICGVCVLILHLQITRIIFLWNVSIISDKQCLVHAVFKNYAHMFKNRVISMLYDSFMYQLVSGLLRNTVFYAYVAIPHIANFLRDFHFDTFGSQVFSGQYSDAHECGCYIFEMTVAAATATATFLLLFFEGRGVWTVHKRKLSEIEPNRQTILRVHRGRIDVYTHFFCRS